MARKEKDFQAEFRQSLRTLKDPCWYHKIVDAGFKNPFDAVLTYGNSYGLEYKITKNKASIALKTLFKGREHQPIELMRMKKAGGIGYMIINVFEPRKRNFIIVLKIEEYYGLIDKGYSTIKFLDPIIKPYIYEKNSEGLWPLNEIFE